MEVIFRKYKTSDFGELAQMVLGLYTKDSQKASEMTIEKVALSVEKLNAAGGNGQILIFETGEGIVGYSIVNSFWSNEFSGRILYIDELYVKPSCRNGGVGAKFLEYLQTSAENDSVAFMLETVRTNDKAIRFYEKNGFVTHHNLLLFKHLA